MSEKSIFACLQGLSKLAFEVREMMFWYHFRDFASKTNLWETLESKLEMTKISVHKIAFIHA